MVISYYNCSKGIYENSKHYIKVENSKYHFFMLALGSNTDATKNIEKAKAMINKEWPEMMWSQSLTTKPIGIISDNFINALACGFTTDSYEKVINVTKNIEIKLHYNKEERQQGIIKIDVDVLQYSNKKCKKNDWNREYMKALIKDLLYKFPHLNNNIKERL